MRVTLRTKLMAIVIVTGLAFVAVFVVSTLSSDRVERELQRMREVYLPLVELGPKLESDFERLGRTYQDAVAALDPELLAAARTHVDRLIDDVASAGAAVDASKAGEFRRALEDYHLSASDVSRRLIAGETGEGLVTAMGAMQRLQKAASAELQALTLLDRDALAHAFTSLAGVQATANEVRLVVSLACLVLVVLLSLALARGVLRALAGLDAGLDRFGRGEFAASIPVIGDDELAHVAERANEMARSLERLEAERRSKDWLEAGHAGLVRTLRGELAPDQVAERALAFLTRYLDAPVAVLYQADAEGVLWLRGRHGLATAPPASLRPGEGLVGQAALSEEILVVSAPPKDHIDGHINGHMRVCSGLGESTPRALVLVPLVRAGRVMGVIELGIFKPWDEPERALLFAARESLAIALDVARASAETKALLAETQAQAERLSRQDETLRAVNEELVRVSAFKSQFLTNMSHELRTPLNSMLLLSSLLADNEQGNLSDKQVEFCRTILASGRDLLALINQVLDLAKVEAGKQQIELGPTRLAEVAARARRIFEPLASDKGLTLAVTLDARLPAVIHTDQLRVDQILTNLLGNAVKFSSAGTVGLHITRPAPGARLGPGLAPATTIALAVSDTGAGIAPADQERVFAAFEQLDAKVDRRYGGTGLGLALSRELAGLLGGELQVESALGKGSTFTLYLPEGEVVADQLPVSSDRGQLLIIEDDVPFARAFGEVARSRGVAHRVATSGSEGLRLVRELTPSGVVLDVKLPDTDGFEVLARLRADPATASLPVYFVSAVDAAHHGLALGAVGYLVKPAGRRDLERVIDALAPDPALGSAPPLVPDGAGLEHKSVLVVDDDMRTVYALSATLGQHGMDVVVAENGRAALEALELRPTIDIVLMDIMMPEMDGYEAMRRIRRDARFATLPIIALTAKAMKGDAQACVSAGASAYLGKPIDTPALLRLMQAQLGLAEAA